MDTVPFLSDIDDELQYSQSLELWILQLTEHLAELASYYPHPHLILETPLGKEHEVMDRMREHNKALKNVLATLWTLIANMAERRKRLADRAVGLADCVVDEEGA